MFGSVAKATAGGQKSEIINNIYGEGYFRIDKTKINDTKAGTFAIVEMTPIHTFGKVEEGDQTFRLGQAYCTMQQEREHDTMFDQFVANYVAAFHGVSVGHQFFEDEDANNAKWVEMCEHAFGKKQLNEAKTGFEIVGSNTFQGAVLRSANPRMEYVQTLLIIERKFM